MVTGSRRTPTRVAGEEQGTLVLVVLTLAAVEDAVGAAGAATEAEVAALVAVCQVVLDEAVFVIELELCGHCVQLEGTPVVHYIVGHQPVLLRREHWEEPAKPTTTTTHLLQQQHIYYNNNTSTTTHIQQQHLQQQPGCVCVCVWLNV